MVNRRRSEIQSDYPGCHVDIQYTMKDPPDKDDEESPFHLLWMSDRVALARFIEYRLRLLGGWSRRRCADRLPGDVYRRRVPGGCPCCRLVAGHRCRPDFHQAAQGSSQQEG